MDESKISNSNTKSEGQKSEPLLGKSATASRIKRKVLKHYKLLRVGILAGILIGIGALIFLANLLFQNLSSSQYFDLAKQFVFPNPNSVSSSHGRTNILVLGKGGVGHTAPDLTDTIVVFSIPQSSEKVISASLPRDLWIAPLRAKLNSAYYWGNEKENGGGIVLAKSTVEEILGTPIHYGVVFDFSAFTEVIDLVGGVDVEVENSFIDEKFPIPGKENDLCDGDLEYKCRYETIEFKEGLNHMNGEVALKFVRSRNAEGDEGTDIAREARQQKVISALRTKLASPRVFLQPKIVFGLVEVVRSSVETDMTLSQIGFIARKLAGANESVNLALPEELIIHPPVSTIYDNQYVFVPKSVGWEEIHSWFQGLINEN